ncbi:TPA: hypothetical protein DIC40_02680 [Patescibacteria group bacterium]|nr:hypothetical protein P148_SR1C00001G0194 [candidate division SR1 bacterium RAAC1_SR1_1]HCY20754.1 hypothetical protein [Candidatus Gracilibacteria bacterium]
MKQSTRIVIILFLSLLLLSSCKSWKEKKDHELQKLIDNIDFDKKIIILEPTYRYLFEQFNEEAIEKAEYKIKLGEKEYFVAQNDEAFYRYGLESYEEEYYLMVSIDTCVLAPRGPKILVMTVKKMEELND